MIMRNQDDENKEYLNQLQTYEIVKYTEDVLISQVPSQQWRDECARVDRTLSIPIQTNKVEGELEDFYNRQNQVVKHLKNVEEFTTGGTPIMLDSLVEKSTKQLKKITKKEAKLNLKNQNKMGTIKDT